MQSVSITTTVVSLNPAHGKVYSIQYNVIKFVSNARHGFNLRIMIKNSIIIAILFTYTGVQKEFISDDARVI